MDFNIFFNDIRKNYTISYFDLSYIVEKITGKSRSEQLFIKDISESDYNKIIGIINEFSMGKPLNKIFNEQNFFGLNFYVDENVLAPRPETEILVEYAIKNIGSNPCKVLDLCSGSGCIGITVKHFCPDSIVTLADISEKAIIVAKKNSVLLNTDVNIIKSDMFSNIHEQKFDFILSNPPYIKNNDIDNISPEVLLYDPHIALFGGDDGLDFYRIILSEGGKFLHDNGKIILEIGYNQCDDIVTIANENNFSVQIIKDYSGIDRVLILNKGS